MERTRLDVEGEMHLQELERRVGDVDHAIHRLLEECREFERFAERLGFSLVRRPSIPGVGWVPRISERRAPDVQKETREAILKGLLITIDWWMKLREWNFDPVRATVTDEDGNERDVQLRGGYKGIIA